VDEWGVGGVGREGGRECMGRTDLVLIYLSRHNIVCVCLEGEDEDGSRGENVTRREGGREGGRGGKVGARHD